MQFKDCMFFYANWGQTQTGNFGQSGSDPNWPFLPVWDRSKIINKNIENVKNI